MYSPFDLLRKKIIDSNQDSFYINSSMHLINDIESVYFSKYNIFILEERKEFIKEFLTIKDFYKENRTYCGDKNTFILINLFLLKEIDLLRLKGALYILKVWNLQPNTRRD